MNFIDTHTHLYVEEFNNDRDVVVNHAIENGVKKMILPAIDSQTTGQMVALSKKYPDNCFIAAGLHPTSVKENFRDELKKVEKLLAKENCVAIGETGIDLYWDKTYENEQKESFEYQIDLAKKYKLPILIHVRNSFDEVLSIVKEKYSTDLHGIFHCFPGNSRQAEEVIEMGFKIGIGGVVTFKKSEMQDVVKHIDLSHIVLETDSPYLAPVPFRGKRNQSAYIKYIAERIAEIKQLTLKDIADNTTGNAMELFG